MSSARVFMERRRTGWDVVLGVLLLLAGMVILGHTVIATVVSVLFLGWMALLTGILALVVALFRLGRGGFWTAALSGGLLTALGLVFVRNPEVAAVTLTLVAGTVFLFTGVIRIVLGLGETEHRWVLLLAGLVSAALGILVLFNLAEATLTLLGLLLGIEVLVDGVTLLLIERLHVVGVRQERAAV